MEEAHVEPQAPLPVPTVPQLQDVSTLLPEASLERLRRLYDKTPTQVAKVSQHTIEGMFPDSLELLQELMHEFYEHTEFARDREQIVIALLAVRMGGRRVYLALHFYWGLMVGLSPRDIAYRLYFVSFYSGIDTLTSSLEILSRLLTELRRLAESGPDEALTPVALMTRMKQEWFP